MFLAHRDIASLCLEQCLTSSRNSTVLLEARTEDTESGRKEDMLQVRHTCLHCHVIVLSQLQEYTSSSCQVRTGLRSGQGAFISADEEKSSYWAGNIISLVFKSPGFWGSYFLLKNCNVFLFPREPGRTANGAHDVEWQSTFYLAMATRKVLPASKQVILRLFLSSFASLV